MPSYRVRLSDAGHGQYRASQEDQGLWEQYPLNSLHQEGKYEDWIKLILPGDRERDEEEITRSLQGGIRLDTVLGVRWPDGSVLHIRVIGQVHRDAKGHHLRMMGISLDTGDE